MDEKGVEEVPEEEIEVEDKGDNVMEVTPEGKRKKPAAKMEKKSRVKKPNKHAEDWLKIIPASSNVISENDHIFRDPYFLVHDSECLRTNGFDLSMFFYENRVEKVLVCNPWNRNMAKLIFPEVFVDVDLLKALTNSYNPTTRTFHRHNGSILCTLDRTSFIEAFGLLGQMDVPIDFDDLKAKFEQNKTYFVNHAIFPHIPFNVKMAGFLPRKVGDFLPLSRF